jgi:hypothetical protein
MSGKTLGDKAKEIVSREDGRSKKGATTHALNGSDFQRVGGVATMFYICDGSKSAAAGIYSPSGEYMAKDIGSIPVIGRGGKSITLAEALA